MHPAYLHYTGSMPFPRSMVPGMPIHPGTMARGFCHGCGHPQWKCVCGCRECRKESKELVVKAELTAAQLRDTTAFEQLKVSPLVMMFDDAYSKLETESVKTEPVAASSRAGIGTAFIGGGCCVHLSVEYMPVSPTAPSRIVVLVLDADGILLGWGKTEKGGVGYQVKECIISTKPGATLAVQTVNMTARLRWCEVFSC